MLKVATEYKGVILLFIVLVVVANMITGRVKQLDATEETTTIAYYEK